MDVLSWWDCGHDGWGIDEAFLEQLVEGRKPGDLFGKDGILQELTRALAELALSTELDAP